MSLLNSFTSKLNVVIIGASGGLGKAFIKVLEQEINVATIYAFSRNDVNSASNKTNYSYIDLENEESIERASILASSSAKIDLVIVATGILHSKQISPEKSFAHLDPSVMMKVFNINTIGPAIIAKYFLPKFRRDTKTVFAVLSARVGSINDNYLGGWASYRASKAALNMLIKTSAIEQKRIAPKCILTSLHPGTVDTGLSRPYQKNIKKGALSNASNAASKLISVINNLNYDDTGSFLAWDGNQIEY